MTDDDFTEDLAKMLHEFSANLMPKEKWKPWAELTVDQRAWFRSEAKSLIYIFPLIAGGSDE